MLSTLARSAEVLDLFDTERPERGVTEVAKALGIPKSTAHGLLATLAQLGLLRRTDGARYRLGWRVLELSETLLESTEFRVEAEPVMNGLFGRFGETIHLGVLERDQVLCVEKLKTSRYLPLGSVMVGGTIPVHGSSMGKVLLAWRPWSEVKRLLACETLNPMTENTITALDHFEDELRQVRRQGFACVVEEAMQELCGVAAPLRDYTGDVVAAISFAVSTPRFTYDQHAYRDALVSGCRIVSENLGYLPRIKSRFLPDRRARAAS